jgi:mono/diheme cytochrome c family protein
MPRAFRYIPSLLLAMTLGAPSAFAEDLTTSSGTQLFQRFSASCHGHNGEGDGPVAPFFKLLPPDLTLISRRHGGSFPADKVQRIIDGRSNLLPHGSREMPIWGMQFANAESDPVKKEAQVASALARLVGHLQSIQK